MIESRNQEGVALEIAEAVIGALKGELASTAVNAPMVPPEVLKKKKEKQFIYILKLICKNNKHKPIPYQQTGSIRARAIRFLSGEARKTGCSTGCRRKRHQNG